VTKERLPQTPSKKVTLEYTERNKSNECASETIRKRKNREQFCYLFFIAVLAFKIAALAFKPIRTHLKNPEPVLGRVREGAFDSKASSRK